MRQKVQRAYMRHHQTVKGLDRIFLPDIDFEFLEGAAAADLNGDRRAGWWWRWLAGQGHRNSARDDKAKMPLLSVFSHGSPAYGAGVGI